MADLESQVSLDISAALSDADQLAQSLGDALEAAISTALGDLGSQLADSLTDVPVTTDTAEAEASIGDLAATASDGATMPVDADTASGEVAVSDLVSSVADETPTLVVEADTSGAETAIADLGGTAEEAGTSVSGLSGELPNLSGSAGVLAVSMGAARGNIAGTAESLVASAGPLAAAGGGFLALGAAAAGFIEVGERAHAATERLNLVFGDAAPDAMALRIGGLSGNLNELAVQAGSSGARMRQATASFGQLAISAGLTQEQAAEAAHSFQALALRATAMNPALGEAGDVMGRLIPALSRGGRFAANFGIALSSAEITTRALADTGKTSAADLSILEKAMAGAALATERLGNKLGSDFSAGTEQAATKLKALKAELSAGIAAVGVPLVEPVLQLAEAFTPLALAIGKAVGSLVTGFLPAVEALVPIVTPLADIIGAFGDVLEFLGPILPAVTIGFLAFEAVTQLLPLAIGGATTAALALTGVLPLTAAAAEAAAAGIATAEETVLAGLGPIGLLIGALGIAATALGLFGDSEKSVADQTHDLAAELAKMNAQQLIRSFEQGSIIRAFADDVSVTTGRLREFRTIAEDNVGTAQRLLNALRASGENTDGYQRILDRAVQSQKDQKVAQDETDAATKQLTGDTSAQAAAQDDLTKKIDAYVSSAAGGLPSVSSAFETATTNASTFGQALSPEFLLENLQSSLGSIVTFTANIKTIFDAGFTDIGALLSEKGAEAGGQVAQQLADGIRSGQPGIAQSLNDAAGQVNVAGQVATGYAHAQGQAVVTAQGEEYAKLAPLVGQFMGLTVDQVSGATPGLHDAAANAAAFGLVGPFSDGVAGVPAAATDAMTGAQGAVAAGTGDLGAAGSGAGAATAGGYGQGIAPMPGIAQGTVLDSVNAARLEGANAHNVGYGIGAAFVEGMADGANANDSLLSSTLADIVRQGVSAAKRAAGIASPSKVFRDEVGLPIMEGWAAGIHKGAPGVLSALETITGYRPDMAAPYSVTAPTVAPRMYAARPASAPAPVGAAGGGAGPRGLFDNAVVNIGSTEVIPKLDYYAASRATAP